MLPASCIIYPDVSFRLFRLVSKRVEPRQHAGVALPTRWLFGLGRLEPLQCFPFGLQIGLSVVIGGIKAGVSQPTSNHGDIYARSYQMDGGGVPKAVRGNVLS